MDVVRTIFFLAETTGVQVFLQSAEITDIPSEITGVRGCSFSHGQVEEGAIMVTVRINFSSLLHIVRSQDPTMCSVNIYNFIFYSKAYIYDHSHTKTKNATKEGANKLDGPFRTCIHTS